MNSLALDKVSSIGAVAREQAADALETLDRILAAKPVRPQPESARRLRGAARWGA